MRKVSILCIALFVCAVSFAGANAVITPSKPVKPNAANIMIPIGTSGDKISLLDLSRMSVKDVEAYTGKKMKVADKIGFKLAQKQLRNSINADGTISDRKISKAAKKAADGSGFHLGGFALGFLLGLIGVLIAYLINDELKSSRTKWAWLGLAAAVVLYLLLIVAVL
jgi:hypothetical protein